MAIETYGCNEGKSAVPIATQPVKLGAGEGGCGGEEESQA